jgi:hypothetical protein
LARLPEEACKRGFFLCALRAQLTSGAALALVALGTAVKRGIATSLVDLHEAAPIPVGW